MLHTCMLSQTTPDCAFVAGIVAKQVGSIAHFWWTQTQFVTLCHAQETMKVLASAQASLLLQAVCSILINFDATLQMAHRG